MSTPANPDSVLTLWPMLIFFQINLVVTGPDVNEENNVLRIHYTSDLFISANDALGGFVEWYEENLVEEVTTGEQMFFGTPSIEFHVGQDVHEQFSSAMDNAGLDVCVFVVKELHWPN